MRIVESEDQMMRLWLWARRSNFVDRAGFAAYTACSFIQFKPKQKERCYETHLSTF